ncbi:hypothetical protein N7507_004543 [Penicillium longicatenatum]|nr:hypothetical protein N7507_004543 [Penicillium longicatenatum]
MIEILEEEALNEETIEEVETLTEACGQLQSELDATIQRNKLLESKINSLQEQVAVYEIKANNNIQHNEFIESKMELLEERVATLEMDVNTTSDDTYSQMASDGSREGRDNDSSMWDSDIEEDE